MQLSKHFGDQNLLQCPTKSRTAISMVQESRVFREFTFDPDLTALPHPPAAPLYLRSPCVSEAYASGPKGENQDPAQAISRCGNGNSRLAGFLSRPPWVLRYFLSEGQRWSCTFALWLTEPNARTKDLVSCPSSCSQQALHSDSRWHRLLTPKFIHL